MTGCARRCRRTTSFRSGKWRRISTRRKPRATTRTRLKIRILKTKKQKTKNRDFVLIRKGLESFGGSFVFYSFFVSLRACRFLKTKTKKYAFSIVPIEKSPPRSDEALRYVPPLPACPLRRCPCYQHIRRFLLLDFLFGEGRGRGRRDTIFLRARCDRIQFGSCLGFPISSIQCVCVLISLVRAVVFQSLRWLFFRSSKFGRTTGEDVSLNFTYRICR